jgi:Helix-turn-helix domain
MTKMESTREEVLLRTVQAAKRLGLSERYLEILRVRGDGPPFVSFGRCIRYRPVDLDRWVEARLRRSTSERFDAGSGASPASRQIGKGAKSRSHGQGHLSEGAI